MMIYMILITKLADLLMLDAIFFQGVAFTFSFDREIFFKARSNSGKYPISSKPTGDI